MSTYEFKLPDVGEGLREGEIIRWHAAPGDEVKAHQILVEVQTDKAIVEIPAPVSGTLERLGGVPGDVITVGAVLAAIESGPPPAEDAASPAAGGSTPTSFRPWRLAGERREGAREPGGTQAGPASRRRPRPCHGHRPP